MFNPRMALALSRLAGLKDHAPALTEFIGALETYGEDETKLSGVAYTAVCLGEAVKASHPNLSVGLTRLTEKLTEDPS